MGIHNGYDLSTKAGLAKAMTTLRRLRPRYVHVSPPCNPWSPLRNGASTPEQKQHLAQQRNEGRKILRNCLRLIQTQRQELGGQSGLGNDWNPGDAGGGRRRTAKWGGGAKAGRGGDVCKGASPPTYPAQWSSLGRGAFKWGKEAERGEEGGGGGRGRGKKEGGGRGSRQGGGEMRDREAKGKCHTALKSPTFWLRMQAKPLASKAASPPSSRPSMVVASLDRLCV